MQKMFMHGSAFLGAICLSVALVGCSSDPSKPQEITSFDQEPIEMSMVDGTVRTYKKQVTTGQETEAIRHTKDDCNFRRPADYYDQLEAKLSAQTKTVYTVTSVDAEYDVAILPNTAGYVSMAQFTQDFAGCGASNIAPLRLTSDWLVLASNCTNDACGQLKAKVDPTVRLK